ncbi:MAG: endonuclease/exonuclease/phosphatase family protein, partial [Bacteroidetes bacterium]|nr:endonuclease/exonuclease/phosphatase family protein [Bacteroidota bacterium]
MKLRLLSLNCRGLNKKKKRLTIFKKCVKYDINCLQESYVTEEKAKEWERDWQGNFFFVEGTNRSKGQIILVNKSFKADGIGIIHKSQRVLGLRVEMGDSVLDIMNIYGPSVKSERGNFLSEVTAIINKLQNDKLITCRDWNMYLNSFLDCISGEPHEASEIRMLNKWVNAHRLVDSWRFFNKNEKTFTWSRINPFIARRLDFCFVSEDLTSELTASRHEIFFATDHKAVTADFSFSNFKRGKSYWKFNDSLLKDVQYTNKIKKLIDDSEKELQSEGA